MITIHKYQFEIEDRVHIEMQSGAKVLSVQIQNGVPTIWAKVDTSRAKGIRTLYIFGTGHEIDATFNYDYIGTIQLNGLVWHVFE